MEAAQKPPQCYGRSVGPNVTQEWYETASRDARRRARRLRQMGFRVSVDSMGSQVTPDGRVQMTLVTAWHLGDDVAPIDDIDIASLG